MKIKTIKRGSRDTLGDTLGAIGQGLSGFAGGYMGGKQMNMAEQNSQSMRDMMQMLMRQQFKPDGSGIQPMPTAQTGIQESGMLPMSMPTGAQGAGAMPMSTVDPELLRMLTPRW